MGDYLSMRVPPLMRCYCMQFHAVALLHALRTNDRLAISKLVTSLVRGSVRSPLAQCLLVRYVAQVPSQASHQSVAFQAPAVLTLNIWCSEEALQERCLLCPQSFAIAASGR